MDFQLEFHLVNSLLQILGGRSVSLKTFKQDFQVNHVWYDTVQIPLVIWFGSNHFFPAMLASSAKKWE